jgi:hypothetical protein
MTWTYNGISGKRSRLRDMGLWIDPPQYYGAGTGTGAGGNASSSFVTVDITVPEVGGWVGGCCMRRIGMLCSVAVGALVASACC